MPEPLRVRLADGSTREYKDIVDPVFHRLFELCAPFTLTAQSGAPAPYALYKAVEYLVKAGVEGDIVECGVWSGGSMLLAAAALVHFGDVSRELYLYDTFEGMPEPSEVDADWDGNPAWPTWKQLKDQGKRWGDGGSEDFVREVMAKSGYPAERMHFVKGLVEQTIPRVAPAKVALLRLDTDLYDSTAHELEHLVPRLSRGGVLIIDDYGYFRGARAATDQFLEIDGNRLYLARIDDSVRLAIKAFD